MKTKKKDSINLEEILKKFRYENPLSEIEIAYPYYLSDHAGVTLYFDNNDTVILYQRTDFGPMVIFTNKDGKDSRILYYNNIENKFMLTGDDPDYYPDYGKV